MLSAANLIGILAWREVRILSCGGVRIRAPPSCDHRDPKVRLRVQWGFLGLLVKPRASEQQDDLKYLVWCGH